MELTDLGRSLLAQATAGKMEIADLLQRDDRESIACLIEATYDDVLRGNIVEHEHTYFSTVFYRNQGELAAAAILKYIIRKRTAEENDPALKVKDMGVIKPPQGKTFHEAMALGNNSGPLPVIIGYFNELKQHFESQGRMPTQTPLYHSAVSQVYSSLQAHAAIFAGLTQEYDNWTGTPLDGFKAQQNVTLARMSYEPLMECARAVLLPILRAREN